MFTFGIYDFDIFILWNNLNTRNIFFGLNSLEDVLISLKHHSHWKSILIKLELVIMFYQIENYLVYF